MWGVPAISWINVSILSPLYTRQNRATSALAGQGPPDKTAAALKILGVVHPFNHGWTRMDTDKNPRVADASSESVTIGVHPWLRNLWTMVETSRSASSRARRKSGRGLPQSKMLRLRRAARNSARSWSAPALWRFGGRGGGTAKSQPRPVGAAGSSWKRKPAGARWQASGPKSKRHRKQSREPSTGGFNNGWKGRSARAHFQTRRRPLRASVLSHPLVVRPRSHGRKNLRHNNQRRIPPATTSARRMTDPK